MQASNRRFAAALSESQFAPAGAKIMKSVFSGGVYVGKKRSWSQASAWPQLR
jgi:hypothetical protein